MTIEVDVVINNKVATKYNHEGEIYIEGRKGSEYTLRIKNKSYEEVLVVPTIDGLSIIDGKEADINNSGGYVISPYQTINIAGWLLDNKSVAAFKFGDIPSSYAVKTGKNEDNIGVIGIAVFSKKKEYKYPDLIFAPKPYNNYPWNDITWNDQLTIGSPLRGSSFGTCTNVSYSTANNNSIGTEFGNKKEYKTTETTFTKNKLENVIEIFYDDAQGLSDRGIVINKKAPKPKPSAFPKSSIGCTPPSDW